MKKLIFFAIILTLFFISCNNSEKNQQSEIKVKKEANIEKVNLDVDINSLSANQKEMIRLFIKASNYIDSMFFYENYSNYQQVLDTLKDENLLEKFRLNFGPWDRFSDNLSYIKNIGEKPLGANFYPSDITKKEFYELKDSCKNSPYTFIRRKGNGELYCVKYNKEFEKYIGIISKLLDSAADLADNLEFAKYLRQRSKDLQTDNYQKSDSIWLCLKNNKLDFIIGPVYISNDNFLNIKTEHQSFVLLKDTAWTAKLQIFNKWLKFLQKAIPVPEKYRAEEPGTNSSIVVYNALYFGGSGKSGGVFYSVLFPIDPQIQMKYGIKNLQFKNVISYKFNSITSKISDEVLNNIQKPYITEDAFFINSLLFEMANSLGIRNTINNKGTVRNAMKEYFFISDYLKNLSLSMFLAQKLFEINEIKTDLKENYYTMVISLVRLIRFGATNNYAISNLVCFNYFVENKAISYDKKGKIVINFEKMRDSNKKLIEKIIILQGNGNFKGMKEFIEKYNYVDKKMFKIINDLDGKNIPTDIQFNQGEKILKF